MPNLKDLLRDSQASRTGTAVNDNGSVEIKPQEPGQPTIIANSEGTSLITAEDNGDIKLGDGAAIRKVINVINDADPDNTSNLATVAAVIERVNVNQGGALIFQKIDSKAAFDTFLLADVIEPSRCLVTDDNPFDYTDTNGIQNLQIIYWEGIVTKPTVGDVLSTTTTATDKTANRPTPEETKTALFSLDDTNNLTDLRANVTDTIEAALTTGLDGKVDKIAGQGLSTNNLTDELLNKISNTPLDTNAALSDKISLSSNVDQVLTSTSNSGGSTEYASTDGPADQKRFVLRALNTGDLVLAKTDDSGLSTIHTVFSQNGISASGNITQSGSSVIDSSNSKFVNLPNNTIAELSGKVDTVAGKDLSDNNFSNNDKTKLDGLNNFNGGTITNDLVLVTNNRKSLVIKPTDNLESAGLAFQNSGSNYTGNIVRNTTSGFSIYSGNEPNIDDLDLSVTFTGDGNVNFAKNITANAITSSGNISGANFTVGNNNQINLSNSSNASNSRNARINLASSNAFAIDLLNDNLTINKKFEFDQTGFSFSDASDNKYALEENQATSHGLTLKAKSQNPPAGATLFTVTDSTGNELFRVENDGSLTSSNYNLWLGTDADGSSGGRRVPKIRDLHYESIPNPSKGQIVEEWLGNSVYFIGTGGGTIGMPRLVVSDPMVFEFQAGDYFYVYNFNTGSDITLSLASGQQQWMRDNVGDIVNGNIILGGNEAFKFSVADISDFSAGIGFVVRRISDTAEG